MQHVHELPDGSEDVKFIGVYSSKDLAQTAIARLKTQPGFRDHPLGFHIDEYLIDEDHWTGGFTTV